MRRAFAALVLLAATAANAAEPATVDQAVAWALEHDANVANARLEVEKGKAEAAAFRTKRLPSFSVDMVGGEALNQLSFVIEKGQFGTFESTGPLPNEDTRIELARTFSMISIARVTQPITQQHAIGLGIRLNEASLAVDEERARAARQAVAREVKSAYFSVLSARRYAEAMREAVAAWEEVDREVNVRVAQKAALEADRLDAAARLAATRAAALSADNALASAMDRLAYLAGREIDPVESPAEVSVKAVAATEAAIAARPDVREAELRVEQARLSVQLKHAERIPDVALMVSSATPINNDALPSNMTSAGITMSYEPFTWGRRSAEMAEKRHEQEQAENALRDKRAVAALEIAVRARAVEEAAAQVAVRKLESETARERLRIVRTRFAEQAARPDEVSNANASLIQAAAREQEAVSAWWTARADYQKAIGEE